MEIVQNTSIAFLVVYFLLNIANLITIGEVIDDPGFEWSKIDKLFISYWIYK